MEGQDVIATGLLGSTPADDGRVTGKSLLEIIAERGDTVSIRSLGGPHDLQEHVYVDRETQQQITLQSQLCLQCSGTGKALLKEAIIDGEPYYKVYPGQGGNCEACYGTGRVPTKRTLRKGLLSAQQRAVRAKQQADIMQAELKQLRAGEPVWAWLVQGEAAEANGAPPGQALIALPHDVEAVRHAKALGAHQAWLYEDDYPVLVRVLQRELEAEENAWVDATETAEWFQGQLEMQAVIASGVEATQRSRAAAAAAAAEAEAAAAAQHKHDPAKVCNGYEDVKGKRKRCHRDPKEWDARGHGWCRRHARKRGLNVRQGDE